MATPVESTVYSARVQRSRMSPEKIRARTFARSPLGRRGVSEHEVTLFCGRMAEEISAWMAENAALRAENDRLKTALRQWQSEQASKRANDNWQSKKPPSTRGPVARSRAAAAQVQREAEAILTRAGAAAERRADPDGAPSEGAERLTAGERRRPYELVLQEAQRRADEEAERVARVYRSRVGTRYTAEFEELERRLAWATTFLDTVSTVEAQLRAARQSLTYEVEHLSATLRR